MIESLKTVEIEPRGELAPCPFCAATPYWQGIVRPGGVVAEFFHPGVSTDKDCVLAGKGFHESETGAWNRRTKDGEAGR